MQAFPVRNRLLLTGGGTRGTLYAVYDFLCMHGSNVCSSMAANDSDVQYILSDRYSACASVWCIYDFRDYTLKSEFLVLIAGPIFQIFGYLIISQIYNYDYISLYHYLLLVKMISDRMGMFHFH